MKIWIHLNGMQQGPYDLPELRAMAIGPDTPVWYEGLTGWLPASAAPATAVLFSEPRPTPPPTPAEQMRAAQSQVAPQQAKMPVPQPPTHLAWAIVLTVICCSPFGIAAIITGSMSSSRYNAGDIEGARRMSETTEWLLIFAIVLAFVTAPLGILMM